MFISVTRLKVKGVWRLGTFFMMTVPSFKQAQQAPGNLLAQTHTLGLLTYGTLTAWESEAAMRAYRNSGAHLEAMKRSRSFTTLLQSTHFEATEAPTWPDALARMEADPKSIKFGRPGKEAPALK
jgi:hypothetical protein